VIPFYRIDVQREVDVIEEILRVYGYNNIQFEPKLNASIAPTSRFEDHKLQNNIANLLAAQGFYEILSNSLSNPDHAKAIDAEWEKDAVKIINPLSSDLSILRTSMLFSALEAASYNINRKRPNLKLFEFGKTYHKTESGHLEKEHLSLLITGDRTAESWTMKSKPSDFYLLKAQVEQILEKMGLDDYASVGVVSEEFSEGIQLIKDTIPLVHLGVVRGNMRKIFDLKQEILFANFDWAALRKLASRQQIAFKAIPKFPAVRRDFALMLNKEVPFKDLEEIAYQTEKKLLKDLSLFDVYTGDKLPKGKKSYAVSFTLQDESKTLTDKHIDKIMNKIKNAYEKQLGAELR
jgi:phenylalanyl-tRNA synthetase beta chain